MIGVLYLPSWTILIKAKPDQSSALVKDENETFCNKGLHKGQIHRPEVPSRGEYTSCWTSMKGNKYLVSIALDSQLNGAQIIFVMLHWVLPSWIWTQDWVLRVYHFSFHILYSFICLSHHSCVENLLWLFVFVAMFRGDVLYSDLFYYLL